MTDLKGQQAQAWTLEDEMAKEYSLTLHLNAKIELEQTEIARFPDFSGGGMSTTEAEKKKRNRELERELDEHKINDNFVAPDHLVPQKLAEDAGVCECVSVSVCVCVCMCMCMRQNISYRRYEHSYANMQQTKRGCSFLCATAVTSVANGQCAGLIASCLTLFLWIHTDKYIYNTHADTYTYKYLHI